MAALSDYLESGLLSHIFRNTAFPRPSTIAIALTSGVPIDSDTGESIPELPSGVFSGLDFVSTNYNRIPLGPPASSGDNTWNQVGFDSITAYSVSGTRHDNNKGYFYPLYLSSTPTNNIGVSFKEFPSVLFFAPANFQSGVSIKSNYTEYEGNGFIRNKNQIIFNTASTDWGWVSGIAIVDSGVVGKGNLLMYAPLANPRYVYRGDNIRFDINSLEISLK